MNLKSVLSVVAVSLIAALATSPADAAAKKKRRLVPVAPSVSGTAAIHAISVEGHRLCFADHYHYGSSMGVASKRAAEIAAIQSWEGFVAFEYGNDWANYAKSSSKSMKCSAPYKGTWSCDLSARPCK